nr:hypothetical protein [uncultured Microbacterium sp.]
MYDDVRDPALGEVSQQLFEGGTVRGRPGPARVDVDVHDFEVMLAGVAFAGFALVWDRQAELAAAHPGLFLGAHAAVDRDAAATSLMRLCRRG